MTNEITQFPCGVVPRSNITVHMPPGAAVPSSSHPLVTVLNDVRAPVWYDIAVAHHWDGTVETWCKGVDPSDPKARISAGIALRSAANHCDPIDETPDPAEVA
jgi:hypothetical protein